MGVAPILDLRRAMVTHLRADSAVTSTSVSNRLYGEKAPAALTWPFGRYGISDAQPGDKIAVPFHLFSKDPFTDDVNGIAEAIGNSLDGKVLTLNGGRKAYITWTGTRLVASEADEWHAIVGFDATIPRDC